MAHKEISQVKSEYSSQWMQIPEVQAVGIGLCDGQPCIKVYASLPENILKDRIPASVEGYKVCLEMTDEVAVRLER